MFKFLVEEIDNKEKSAERIAYLEQKYGIVFPVILKELYGRTNGGILKENEVPVNGDPDNLAEVWCMHKLGDSDFNFEFVADNDRTEPMNEYIPDDWYPFAYDRGGATFYWSSKDHKVWFMIKDDPDSLEEPDLVADSIEEFIELLNNSIVEE